MLNKAQLVDIFHRFQGAPGGIGKKLQGRRGVAQHPQVLVKGVVHAGFGVGDGTAGEKQGIAVLPCHHLDVGFVHRLHGGVDGRHQVGGEKALQGRGHHLVDHLGVDEGLVPVDAHIQVRRQGLGHLPHPLGAGGALGRGELAGDLVLPAHLADGLVVRGHPHLPDIFTLAHLVVHPPEHGTSAKVRQRFPLEPAGIVPGRDDGNNAHSQPPYRFHSRAMARRGRVTFQLVDCS